MEGIAISFDGASFECRFACPTGGLGVAGDTLDAGAALNVRFARRARQLEERKISGGRDRRGEIVPIYDSGGTLWFREGRRGFGAGHRGVRRG